MVAAETAQCNFLGYLTWIQGSRFGRGEIQQLGRKVVHLLARPENSRFEPEPDRGLPS